MKTTKFHRAYNWLLNHPYFYHPQYKEYESSCFKRCLDIDVVMVNPETDRIEDEHNLNTVHRVWIETGKIIMCDELNGVMEPTSTHDYRLDCGGSSFEEVIIKLAELVKIYIGLYNIEGSNKQWEELPWVERH